MLSMLILNLSQFVLLFLVLIVGIFLFDQKQILALQRAGRYDPETHQTMLSRLVKGLKMVKLFFTRKNKHLFVTKAGYQDLNINDTIFIDLTGKAGRSLPYK